MLEGWLVFWIEYQFHLLLQILSWYPRVVHFPNFIDKERREKIIELASLRLAPSVVAMRKGETRESTKNIRTSSGVFLDTDHDPSGTLKWLEDKIADTTLIPADHGEVRRIFMLILLLSFNIYTSKRRPIPLG